jgi:hypothetical protein
MLELKCKKLASEKTREKPNVATRIVEKIEAKP